MMSFYPTPSATTHSTISKSLPQLSLLRSNFYPLNSKSLRPRADMSSSATSTDISPTLPPLPDKRIVLGCGAVALDYLATVAAFPKPDDKIRSTSLKVQGGGNTGNTLTSAARLGLAPRLISKVVDDTQGRSVLAELEADGVDTSYFVVAKEGNSPFTYVIVDNETKTRTCIHTPGHPAMVPDDLSRSNLLSALNEARLVYLDGRLHETALVVAQEATRMKIPIIIDAERKREGLDDLLNLADYVVCSAKFPQAWTTAPSVPSALLAMLLRLPHIKFVIVTLGENGCIMLERSVNGESRSSLQIVTNEVKIPIDDLVLVHCFNDYRNFLSTLEIPLTEGPELEEMDIDHLLESLKQSVDGNIAIPTCVSSKSTMRLSASGVGTVSGRLRLGTAETIPPSELIDTTGAGDAFIGAIIYSICAGMPPEKMLPFAARVAAAGCRALGARTGLPKRTDPLLVPFLR